MKITKIIKGIIYFTYKNQKFTNFECFSLPLKISAFASSFKTQPTKIAQNSEVITKKIVADMLSKAGINRLITMDLHADQIQGFFDCPVDHLYASSVIMPYIANEVGTDNLCIASPDAGGSKRAYTYAKYFNVPMVMCDKHRDKPNSIGEMFIIGDVEGKDVVLIDDMVDTAGTITKAANLIMEKGAKSVRACASHCVMSGPASERVEASALKEIVFTDSIHYRGSCPKVKSLTISNLFAETIRRVMNNEPISSQFLI